ncbi:MAG TPA: hypothetical protein VFV52_03015 [Bacilli bacterium]|nr:hypothetical protein [Bacilli bacterium]
MKTPREVIHEVESKILPLNQIDHRFRLEHVSFGLDNVSLQATLLTSNERDYSIQCNYSYNKRAITEWMMLDAYGTEFQVSGIVSKTLMYFARKSCRLVFEALGYPVED